jgi:hypothetical protein
MHLVVNVLVSDFSETYIRQDECVDVGVGDGRRYQGHLYCATATTVNASVADDVVVGALVNGCGQEKVDFISSPDPTATRNQPTKPDSFGVFLRYTRIHHNPLQSCDIRLFTTPDNTMLSVWTR